MASFTATCNTCVPFSEYIQLLKVLKFVLQIKNYETGEVGGPAGSRKGAEPTRFGELSSIAQQQVLAYAESRNVT